MCQYANVPICQLAALLFNWHIGQLMYHLIGTLAYWHIATLFIILKLPAHPSPRVLP